MAMAAVSRQKTAPRIYITKKQSHEKWLALCNQEKTKQKKPLIQNNHKFIYACTFALKKNEVTPAEWKQWNDEMRKTTKGEEEFLKICEECNLHVDNNNANKKQIVHVMKALHKAIPRPVAVKPEIKPAPQVAPTTAVTPTELLLEYRNAQKNLLIPYVSSLFQLRVLKSDEHPPEVLLSAKVLDRCARILHQQWTRKVKSHCSHLQVPKTH